MIKHIKYSFILLLLCAFGCTNEPKKQPKVSEDEPISAHPNAAKSTPAEIKEPQDFVPTGFVIFEKLFGDLNKDGEADCVLIVKGTKKDKIIEDEYRGVLDQNRRGIIILLKDGKTFQLASQNLNCFSSENEDGGIYYAPELSINIDLGKLYIHYAHGRYGYWHYTFRLQNNDFELIGYESTLTQGPVINSITSVNFSTKRKQVKENTNEDLEPGDEVFTESWTTLKNKKMIRLTEIKNFDDLYEFN